MATFYQAPRRSSTDLNGKSGVTWLPIAVTNGAFPSSKFITRKNRLDDGRRASSRKRDIAYILISRISDNGSYEVTEILDDAAYRSFFFFFLFLTPAISSHTRGLIKVDLFVLLAIKFHLRCLNFVSVFRPSFYVSVCWMNTMEAFATATL